MINLFFITLMATPNYADTFYKVTEIMSENKEDMDYRAAYKELAQSYAFLFCDYNLLKKQYDEVLLDSEYRID